ncbi:MAG TPA: HAMP domain-containing sensor histidine kinase [Prolixibacteraceae bacterium]|nr:HAMP domain-containing sensor histidine kinase [Prolixibacteraceae bacterium]
MENIKGQKNQILNTTDFKLINRSHLEDLGYAQIISTISHELRTPVSILKSNIQMFKDFNFNVDQDLKDESISMCEESVENIICFLNDIQLLNKAIQSEIIPTYSTFNAREIIDQEYLEMARLNLEYSRILIQWDLADTVIISDLVLLRRILTNLLSNALKFSREKVLLFISANHQQLSIIVQDRGVGIPEEELEMVFKPFYRATNAQRKPGIGLGLAIVSTLTQSLCGNLYISSTIDQGTTMKIVLPYET